MSYVLNDTITASNIIETPSIVLNWTYLGGASDLRLFVQNAGGGGGNPITAIEVEYSTDNGQTVESSDLTIIAGPINSGVTAQGIFNPTGKTHARLKLNCGAGNTTTARAWMLADVYLYPYNLATLAELKSFMGIASTVNDSSLQAILAMATSQIETYCDRKFFARTYACEQHQGDGTGILYTKQWPIISVERIAVGLAAALQVKCSSADAFGASVSVVRTENGPRINMGLNLKQYGGANADESVLSFSDYPTITLLAAAINLLPGWEAFVIGDYGKHGSNDLVPVSGRSCYNVWSELDVPEDWIQDFRIDRDSGEIYYSPNFSSSWQNIYLDYKAGYTDLPDALKYLCMEIAADVFNARKINNNLQSETIGDYSYTKADVQKMIAKRYPDLSIWRKW